MDRQHSAGYEPRKILQAEKLELHAIEPDEPGVGRQPKVAILILQHILDGVLRQTLFGLPNGGNVWGGTGLSANGTGAVKAVSKAAARDQ